MPVFYLSIYLSIEVIGVERVQAEHCVRACCCMSPCCCGPVMGLELAGLSAQCITAARGARPPPTRRWEANCDPEAVVSVLLKDDAPLAEGAGVELPIRPSEACECERGSSPVKATPAPSDKAGAAGRSPVTKVLPWALQLEPMWQLGTPQCGRWL